MNDLAPAIYRQRLLIEGTYGISVEEEKIKEFYNAIVAALGLTTYAAPLIHCSRGEGSIENQGFEAFQPLIESGIALYIWEQTQFLSMIIYTCKRFDEKEAISFVQHFFKLEPIAHKSF
jgi:S-adenosylmethionine/arginine decarboxylase-like enzyme